MPRKTVMNNLTTPELLGQVNPENRRLKEEFLGYLRSVNRSDGTIAGYSNDLDIVNVYILQRLSNKPFQKLTKRDIVEFQNWLINVNKNSPARVRRIKAAISSLSRYIENILDDEPEFQGYRSIVRKIENPPLTPVREKTVWTDEELEGLLDTLTERGEYEKACFIALGMYGGRRKSELCRFGLSDFCDSRVVCDGALYKSAPILTKGGKMLECYTLKKRFDPFLNAWLEERERQGIQSKWLFPMPSNPEEHIQISTANNWANICSDLTGRDFYFHSLRHYFVSALSKAGIPDGVLVEIMGWASAQMVGVYNDNPKDDKIAMYFKDGDICVSAAKDIRDV